MMICPWHQLCVNKLVVVEMQEGADRAGVVDGPRPGLSRVGSPAAARCSQLLCRWGSPPHASATAPSHHRPRVAPPTVRRAAETFLRPQCDFLEQMAGIARLILTAEETQKRELCHPSWGAIS